MVAQAATGEHLQRPGTNAGILKSGFAGSLAILWGG